MNNACRALFNVLLRDYGLNRNEGIERQAEWLYNHYVDHIIYAMLARTSKYTDVNITQIEASYINTFTP